MEVQKILTEETYVSIKEAYDSREEGVSPKAKAMFGALLGVRSEAGETVLDELKQLGTEKAAAIYEWLAAKEGFSALLDAEEAGTDENSDATADADADDALKVEDEATAPDTVDGDAA